jgi:hypothetical protein
MAKMKIDIGTPVALGPPAHLSFKLAVAFGVEDQHALSTSNVLLNEGTDPKRFPAARGS